MPVRRLYDNSRLPARMVLAQDNTVIGTDVYVVPTGTGTATPIPAEESARIFLRTHLAALAPNVAESELRVKESCDVAPSFGGTPGKTVIFERVIEGRPVIGSSISVRVDGSGAILNINNSLAPIANRLVTHHASSFRSIAAFSPAKRPQLSRLVTDGKRRTEVLKKGNPVLVPVRSGPSEGMVKADHILWMSGGELKSGFLLPDKTVLTPTVVPETRNDRSIPAAYLDKRTNLPTFISYRRRGGLPVSAVGVFNNPAEIAFRYLEENPNVFRTGAARCQFTVVDVRKSSLNPGTSFVKLGQVMAGIPVYGSELVFEIERGNRIQTIQGHTIGHIVRIEPTVGPEVARVRAAQLLITSMVHLLPQVQDQIRRHPITTELVIFPGELVAQKGLDKNPPTSLAYHTRSLLHGLFVDAINGNVLYGYSLSHGANIIREAGGMNILQKPSFTEVVRNGVPATPGTALSPDAAAAVPLVTGTANFYSGFGWSGLDGNGSDMVANVNVNLFTCPNAFSPPIDEESYFCTGEVVGDVVAHELTHGVIWNSSNMIYADEPGALNESFADIMGNLAFPDVVPPGSPAGTLPGWLLGESVVGTMSIRNMADPASSTPVPQPGNYSGYLSRNALGCSGLDVPGLLCDFGGVHINSGINSRAYVLMSDGGLGSLVGMGRTKTAALAFDVMTLRLSKWSRLIDSAIATKASCDTALGGASTGPTFAQIDCDQIPGSFAAVGLDPDLVSDWIPPTAGFAGTITQHAGETTDNSCIITDVALQMNTPAGLVDSRASVVAGGAPLSVNYFGLITATIPVTTPPIGGVVETHAISWTSMFGETPEISSNLTAPPTVPGNSNCRGNLITETKVSGIAQSPVILLLGGADTLATGNAASNMNSACVLVKAEVELVNGSGSPIGDTGTTSTWSKVVYVTFIPVTLTRTATITAQPPGAAGGSFNLSAPVAWSYSVGVGDARWRLVYTIDKPPGVTCTP